MLNGERWKSGENEKGEKRAREKIKDRQGQKRKVGGSALEDEDGVSRILEIPSGGGGKSVQNNLKFTFFPSLCQTVKVATVDVAGIST